MKLKTEVSENKVIISDEDPNKSFERMTLSVAADGEIRITNCGHLMVHASDMTVRGCKVNLYESILWVGSNNVTVEKPFRLGEEVVTEKK